MQDAAKKWLGQQKLGSVTPAIFQRALNNDILPSRNVVLKRPLSNRTARRWLVKLGYRRVELKKGTYVDGHEREDVVKYRDEEFLPRLVPLEARMTQYIGPELVPKPPTLKPGEKRIIAQFHDESSFHANEFKRNAWYAPLAQPCTPVYNPCLHTGSRSTKRCCRRKDGVD